MRFEWRRVSFWTTPVGAKAKHCAHQFARLHAFLRKEFELLRDVDRGIKAAKTRSPAEVQSTSIHEAGHAALLIALDLDLKFVSIIPSSRERTSGQVFSANGDVTAARHGVAREAIYLRHAMVHYAGAEAVRQLIPTDPDPDAGASSDQRGAAKLIAQHIGGDARSIQLLFALAKRRCALLVAHYQPEIQALAAALEEKLILSGNAARKVFMKSLAQRSGQLMTFRTDPTLQGLAVDAAFQDFLRGLRLPH